ncbi:hypothetical protein RRG08_063926 [Elysia crispata]|uniref:Uncharacterized protein n=1 Tax=Elysia crispata TaxID=231223 RepID=A0AAE0YEF1_9GAST|nr:hypothetical protein RRG08_063926 [Elysia crispata]
MPLLIKDSNNISPSTCFVDNYASRKRVEEMTLATCSGNDGTPQVVTPQGMMGYTRHDTGHRDINSCMGALLGAQGGERRQETAGGEMGH